jgi:hypothetical protein
MACTLPAATVATILNLIPNQVHDLWFDMTRFTGPVGPIVEALKTQQQIDNILTHQVNFDEEEDPTPLFQALSELPNLRTAYVSFSDSQVAQEYADASLSIFAKMKTLVKLDLAMINCRQPIPFSALRVGLKNNQRLRQLGVHQGRASNAELISFLDCC